MTETLYRITLSYLRNNPQLLNFTLLNHQTRIDLFKVIENQNHLSNVLTCYKVYNWDALYSYIAKYYQNTKHVLTSKLKNSRSTSGLKSYIKRIYVTAQLGVMYEPHKNTIHYIGTTNSKIFEYKYSGKNIIDKGTSISPNDMVYDYRVFEQFPDLIKWALVRRYISPKMFIYRDCIQKNY